MCKCLERFLLSTLFFVFYQQFLNTRLSKTPLLSLKFFLIKQYLPFDFHCNSFGVMSLYFYVCHSMPSGLEGLNRTTDLILIEYPSLGIHVSPL